MLINPFKLEDKEDINVENENANTKINDEEIILNLRENVISKYVDLLKEGFQDKLKEKLYKDIYL